MSTAEQQIISALKQAGYSATKPRLAVFRALTKADSMTMHELTEQLNATVDRATVYRTIELFERLGIAYRIQVGWKYRLELSDTFSPHHHHIHCQTCGKIVTLPEHSKVEVYIESLAQKAGFTLRSHQLELTGTCQNCKTRQKKNWASIPSS